jgi:hypothetical protein
MRSATVFVPVPVVVPIQTVSVGAGVCGRPHALLAPSADALDLLVEIRGLTHKDIRDARLIRDAEEAEPGNCALAQRRQFHEKLFREFAGPAPPIFMGDHEHAL